jgi:hypothetical protein
MRQVIFIGRNTVPGEDFNKLPVKSLADPTVAGVFWLLQNTPAEDIPAKVDPSPNMEHLLQRIDNWAPGQIPYFALDLGNGNYDFAYNYANPDGVWEVAPLVRTHTDRFSAPFKREPNVHYDMTEPARIIRA